MFHLVRLSLFIALLALASCHTRKLQHIDDAGVRAVTAGFIELEDGRKLPLPFAGQENARWIFLVRHAEKAYGSDPPLNPEGVARAALLSQIFREAPLSAVYSTNFIRTMQTAEPAARKKGLEIQQYEPNRLTTFSYRLKREHRGEAVLVVGHSNTTPILANRIMNKGMLEPIDERDYDNIYLVAVSENGDREMLALKFGKNK